MLEENKEDFENFRLVHSFYSEDDARHQDTFNHKGEKIMKIIREWETRLCGHMEKGDNAVYSARLSEKFWGEIRREFPLIDFVGVKIS